jgi:nephrocystin-3
LDKLSDDNAKSLNWISDAPESTKLILSTVKDPVVMEHIKNMNYQIVEMPVLDMENRKTLIKNYLDQYRKNLTENQINKLTGDKKTENPLALITILDELRMFGKFEELDLEIERYLGVENIPGLFKLVLERLEKNNAGKKEFVRDVFSLLYVSQEGLYENEILKIAGNKPLYWSQLFNGMANHLIIRGDKVAFAHTFIRDAVKNRYLPQKTEEKQFRDKIVMFMKDEDVSDNRKYDELSWQYFELENWDDLYNLLLSFDVTDYLLQNSMSHFSGYWRALLDIDKQKYAIEKYLSLDTQGRKKKEMSAFFVKMSSFVAESLFDSSASAKFTRKSIDLAGGKNI